MFNYDRAIYKTIDDEIQLCLIMIELYITLYIKQFEWWNSTLFNYDRAIYKIIDDEIQLCLIMTERNIKQLMMKYNFV